MNDFELMQECDHLASQGCGNIGNIVDLEQYAISEDTRKYIHDKAVYLYRREEAACGLM